MQGSVTVLGSIKRNRTFPTHVGDARCGSMDGHDEEVSSGAENLPRCNYLAKMDKLVLHSIRELPLYYALNESE